MKTDQAEFSCIFNDFFMYTMQLVKKPVWMYFLGWLVKNSLDVFSWMISKKNSLDVFSWMVSKKTVWMYFLGWLVKNSLNVFSWMVSKKTVWMYFLDGQ